LRAFTTHTVPPATANTKTFPGMLLVAINETCRTGSGYSSILDVNAPGGGGFDDFQESFWFAEVLVSRIISFVQFLPWKLLSLPRQEAQERNVLFADLGL